MRGEKPYVLLLFIPWSKLRCLALFLGTLGLFLGRLILA